LELVLADKLRRVAPLVGLGRSGEQPGAGRIESEEESWHSDFHLLARRARAIYVVPAPNEGTQWEIAEILKHDKLLSKTIFIIPPLAEFSIEAPRIGHAPLDYYTRELRRLEAIPREYRQGPDYMPSVIHYSHGAREGGLEGINNVRT